MLGQVFACRLNVTLLRPSAVTDCHYYLHEFFSFLDRAMYEYGFSTLPLKINFSFPLKMLYMSHPVYYSVSAFSKPDLSLTVSRIEKLSGKNCIVYKFFLFSLFVSLTVSSQNK